MYQKDEKLYAASDLGDYLIWDLQHFYDDYCSLMRSVWDDVDVALESGVIVPQPPPNDHPCAGPSRPPT